MSTATPRWRSNSWRGVAVAVLAILCLQPNLALATSAVRTDLTAVNTVIASRSSVVEVWLRTAAVLRVDSGLLRSPDISITGGGRFAGLAIVADMPAAKPTFVFAVNVNGCWTPGCTTPADERLFPQPLAAYANATARGSLGGVMAVTLEPGRYRLYLLADGQPVRATLRLAGLRGSLTIRPRTPAAGVNMTSVAPNLGAIPTANGQIYSAGATGHIGAPVGLLLDAMEVRTLAHVSDIAGGCYYQNTKPTGSIFLPGCPGGQPSPNLIVNEVGANLPTGQYGYGITSSPGNWTQGDYFESVGVVTQVFPAAYLWLDPARAT